MKNARKALVILCAAAVCVLRFVSFQYEAALSPGLRRAFFIISLAAAALCAAGAALWVITEKKEKNGT